VLEDLLLESRRRRLADCEPVVLSRDRVRVVPGEAEVRPGEGAVRLRGERRWSARRVKRDRLRLLEETPGDSVRVAVVLRAPGHPLVRAVRTADHEGTQVCVVDIYERRGRKVVAPYERALRRPARGVVLCLRGRGGRCRVRANVERRAGAEPDDEVFHQDRRRRLVGVGEAEVVGGSAARDVRLGID